MVSIYLWKLNNLIHWLFAFLPAFPGLRLFFGTGTFLSASLKLAIRISVFFASYIFLLFKLMLLLLKIAGEWLFLLKFLFFYFFASELFLALVNFIGDLLFETDNLLLLFSAKCFLILYLFFSFWILLSLHCLHF